MSQTNIQITEQWPRLSVVMPNYNHGRYLPTSVGALLAQSVQPDEIIVVDDASTDDSLEILGALARQHPHLKVVRNERNQGVLPTVNRGFHLSTGDVIFFPGADDEVRPGFIEASMKLWAQRPEAALSCTASEWCDVAAGLRWLMAADMADQPGYLSPDDLVRLSRQRKLLVVAHSAIYRREPMAAAGLFIEDLRWHSDWFLCYSTAFRHGILYHPEPFSVVNMHASSFYGGRNPVEHERVLLGILENLTSPKFADIADRVRDSAVLGVFGSDVVKLLRRHPEHQWFLTPWLRFIALRRGIELTGKKILPSVLKRLVLKLLYRGK
ncbi:MAG: glycosyltransferase [Pedosphaera sp.]|nr:glycosyltransferase [Pedosphaera sp.]